MSLIKQARFYTYRDAKQAMSVVRDISDLLNTYREEDFTNEEYAHLLFDYNSQATRQVGFVPLYDGHCQSATDEVMYYAPRGNWFVLSVLQREKKIDQSQLLKEVEKRAAEHYNRTGEEIRGREHKELTNEVREDLLAKNATMKYKRANVYISQKHGLLCVDSASEPFCETVIAFLRTAIGTMPVTPYPDVDQADNIDLRAVSTFQELTALLYRDDEVFVLVEDWLKAEQRQEGKVTMKNAPTEVLESLIANRYRPIKYALEFRVRNTGSINMNYENGKLTAIAVDDFAEDMLTEYFENKVAKYWGDMDINVGILDNIVAVLKCLGSDIDEEGELGL